VSEIDWVTARHQCSTKGVFEKLKSEVARDVQIRMALNVGQPHGFEFQASGDEFRVMTAGILQNRVVAFKLSGKSIVVDLDDQRILEGTVTLSDEGQCRLKVGEGEYEHWQFRKRALEQLFFGL
jgi:hypothetical protein